MKLRKITAEEKQEIEDAKKLVGVSDFYDLKKLLNHYFVGYMVLMENEETKKCRPLTDAKSVLVRQVILQMVADTGGYFDLRDKIPFDHICPKCHGTGEIYNFLKRTISVKCRNCTPENTDKQTTKPCRCRGKGYVKLHRNADKFQKRPTHCHECKGRGFIIPEIEEAPAKVIKTPDNPVISIEEGEKIVKNINT